MYFDVAYSPFELEKKGVLRLYIILSRFSDPASPTRQAIVVLAAPITRTVVVRFVLFC